MTDRDVEAAGVRAIAGFGIGTMKGYKVYPKIASVEAQPNKQLLVRFRNGVTKLYDCRRILKYPAFEPLRDNEALFRRVRTEQGGYAVIWNDDLDLAESELWIAGKVVRDERAEYGSREVKKAAKHRSPEKARRSKS